MENLILEPLKYYQERAKNDHEQNIKQYFDHLISESKIDVEENRKTAALFRKKDKIANKTKDKINRLKVYKALLIVLAVLSGLALLVGLFSLEGSAKLITIIVSIALFVFSILFITLKLNKTIKKSEQLYLHQREKADKIYKQALEQMRPLNALFSEHDTFNLIEKIIPNLKFSRDYSLELDQEFKNEFSFDSRRDIKTSVVNTISGRYNENPFMFFREIKQYMSTKTYTGTKIISWQETYRDSDGKLRTRIRTETLIATLVKPYPMYSYLTALNYGNQTAPDLSFSREHKHIDDWTEGKIDRYVKKGQKKLRKKAQKATETGGDFTEMANSEFDVLFGATDRDHEVQFRVMFSPIAQLNMVKLMRSEEGYGDDFSFIKRGKHNYIKSEHAQNWQMDTSPQNYFSYDIDIAQNKFTNINREYFKSVYFDFAPLFAIPAYHQKPSLIFEDFKKKGQNYSEFECEVLANAIGARNFAHPASRTENILKARHVYSNNTTDCMEISAHSFAEEHRLDFVPTMGGDGKIHAVPVHWIEYIPITKQSQIAIKRIGLSEKEFREKASDKAGEIFSSPSAYYHGMFAKILEKDDIGYVDNILEKIK